VSPLKRIVALSVLTALAGAVGTPLALGQPDTAAVRFAALEVYVDAGEPLAAWQFELTEATGAMAVVGVENGDSPVFAEAPRYDLEAVAADRADRIIVADYSLAPRDALPTGRTRIATVHVRLTGVETPDFDLQLIAAGNADGQPIPATVVYELNEGRAQ
jgi:hypothetical protein